MVDINSLLNDSIYQRTIIPTAPENFWVIVTRFSKSKYCERYENIQFNIWKIQSKIERKFPRKLPTTDQWNYNILIYRNNERRTNNMMPKNKLNSIPVAFIFIRYLFIWDRISWRCGILIKDFNIALWYNLFSLPQRIRLPSSLRQLNFI